jgi:hypothetical protein
MGGGDHSMISTVNRVARCATVLVVCTLILGISPAQAQEPYNLAAPVHSLARLFTDLYGPNGLIVDSLATLPGEQPHSAHFNSSFQSGFTQFNVALVGQLVSVPLPSPGSGFTYRFDPTLGVFQRTTSSFGPILAERADTIGAGRLAIGFAVQRFGFDTIEGQDLERIPAVFTHDHAELLGGRQDVITTTNSIQATVSQSTSFITYGVNDRFDVSLAVPLVSVNLRVVSDAAIHRLGTTNELTHFFRQSNGDIGERRLFTAVGSAAGIGDVLVRMKTTLRKRESSGVAIGLDVRVPTGDANNLLGSGTTGIQPFALWSSSIHNVSPHANVSYTWNGSSILAGSPASGQASAVPDEVRYAVGGDVAISQRVTFAVDLLGRTVIRAERMQPTTFAALDGVTTFPDIGFSRDTFSLMTGSMGLKINLVGRLLAEANVLFALDEHGLRDRVTPLLGLQYTF